MEIVEVRIETARPAELRRYYAESLGLPVSTVGGVPADGFAVTIGASTLVVAAAISGERPVYHLAFTVPPDALAAGKAWVAARTPLLTNPDGRDAFRFDDWRASSVYFADPVGNILELIAWDAPISGVTSNPDNLVDADVIVNGDPTETGASDVDRATVVDRASDDDARPFGPACLLAVGEVGIVVPDVPGTVGHLREAGFEPYNDDWSPEFAPVGDPTGRLIVVPVGRPWFPVGLPAVSAPLAVTLRGARRDAVTPIGTRTTISVVPS